jgi:outer membrane protein assembly factor BamB
MQTPHTNLQDRFREILQDDSILEAIRPLYDEFPVKKKYVNRAPDRDFQESFRKFLDAYNSCPDHYFIFQKDVPLPVNGPLTIREGDGSESAVPVNMRYGDVYYVVSGPSGGTQLLNSGGEVVQVLVGGPAGGPSGGTSTIVQSGGNIFIADNQTGTITNYSVEDGKNVWQIRPPANGPRPDMISSIAVYGEDKVLAMNTEMNQIQVFDILSGEYLGSMGDDAALSGPYDLATYGKYIIAVSSGGQAGEVVIIDGMTGQGRKITFGDDVRFSAVTVDEKSKTVYLATRDSIYAYDLLGAGFVGGFHFTSGYNSITDLSVNEETGDLIVASKSKVMLLHASDIRQFMTNDATKSAPAFHNPFENMGYSFLQIFAEGVA